MNYSDKYLESIKERAMELSYRSSIPQVHANILREAAEAIDQLLREKKELTSPKMYGSSGVRDLRMAG